MKACIIDDDSEVRASTSALLRARGYAVSEFESGNIFLESGPVLTPQVALIDLEMPGLTGLEVLETIKQRGLPLASIIITGHGDIKTAVQAMRTGAADFVEKPYAPQELLEAIGRAERELAEPEPSENAELLASLTARENEVLSLLLEGHVNKVIARKLDISVRTVEVHRASVKRKLKAKTLADLIRVAGGTR